MSSSLALVFGSAFLTYTVTNIDAFCVLVLFFAKAKIDEGSTNLNVCIGQFVGFSIIVGISLLGLALSASINPEYVSLLGFVPIMMSIRLMYYDWDWELIKKTVCCENSPACESVKVLSFGEQCGDVELGAVDDVCPFDEEGSDDGNTNDGAVCSDSADGLGGLDAGCDLGGIELTGSTQDTGLEDLFDSISVVSGGGGGKGGSSSSSLSKSFHLKTVLSRYFPAQMVEVAIVALSNGGDNIATYLPFFAACSTQELLITIAVYYVMLCVWLVAAFVLLNDRHIIGFLHKYGHYVVPLCLVATGVYILSDSILFNM